MGTGPRDGGAQIVYAGFTQADHAVGAGALIFSRRKKRL
jgi:hypothetical protein